MLPLSYPLGDLMHLAAFSTVMLRQPRNPVFRALAAAILLGLASDVVYGVELLAGSETAGGISDVLLALSWVCMRAPRHLQFVQGPAPAPASLGAAARGGRSACCPTSPWPSATARCSSPRAARRAAASSCWRPWRRC